MRARRCFHRKNNTAFILFYESQKFFAKTSVLKLESFQKTMTHRKLDFLVPLAINKSILCFVRDLSYFLSSCFSQIFSNNITFFIFGTLATLVLYVL